MPSLPPLLKEGSVKNIFGDKEFYYFQFTDRYSIFDWGNMPDLLPGKGDGLAVTADLFFRILEKPWIDFDFLDTLPEDLKKELEASDELKRLQVSGISHHSFGMVNQSLKPVTLGKIGSFLAVKPIELFEPSSVKNDEELIWNYESYQNRIENLIMPLEVVFRFGIPDGSSLPNRMKQDEVYASQVGLGDGIAVGEWLDAPIVEYSTKLEPTDRYLYADVAQSISGATDEEWHQVRKLTLLIAMKLKKICADVGLELWDGKFEFAFGEKDESGKRSLILIDSIGPDELRLVHSGTLFSKEILRQYYFDSDWGKAVREAKKIAANEGLVDWKKICLDRLGQKPEPLPEKIKNTVGGIYPAFANALAGQLKLPPIFRDAEKIQDLLQKVEEIE